MRSFPETDIDPEVSYISSVPKRIILTEWNSSEVNQKCSFVMTVI